MLAGHLLGGALDAWAESVLGGAVSNLSYPVNQGAGTALGLSLTPAQRRFRAVCHFRTSAGSGFVGRATTWRPSTLSFLLHQV